MNTKSSQWIQKKPNEYKELLNKNIHKGYKKAEKRQEAKINEEAKTIADTEIGVGRQDRDHGKARRLHNFERP